MFYRDNDRSSLNCASMLKGGWWWKSCGRGLNGLYLNDPQDLTARQGDIYAYIFIYIYVLVHNLIYSINKNIYIKNSLFKGIVWFRWRGWDYTLKRATMMIKPKGPTTITI